MQLFVLFLTLSVSAANLIAHHGGHNPGVHGEGELEPMDYLDEFKPFEYEPEVHDA